MATGLLVAAGPSHFGSLRAQEAARITTSWVEEPLRNVLLAFADFTGRSIVPSVGADQLVTATIVNQPWDVALRAIASSVAMVLEEDEHGILYVTDAEEFAAREDGAPMISKAYRLSYADGESVTAMATPLLSPRGSLSTALTGKLLVTDLPRVHRMVQSLLSQVDVELAQVSIRAKIVFVNRTRLDEMGVGYELVDRDVAKVGEAENGTDESVAAGDELQVSLDGHSIEALGNAAVRIAGPSLQLLASLVLGRHRFDVFLDALEAAGLSEIEAEPQVTTLVGRPAEIHVGEVTPIRTIDAGGGGGFPTAQVSQQETGIILRATPHVTADGGIVLDLEAERSAAEPAASDVGYIFRTQRATTRVLVDDGGTVVIAGLTQREHIETVSGIPLLMNLPVLGSLFRVARGSSVQRDLVILVTPTIVGRGFTAEQVSSGEPEP